MLNRTSFKIALSLVTSLLALTACHNDGVQVVPSSGTQYITDPAPILIPIIRVDQSTIDRSNDIAGFDDPAPTLVVNCESAGCNAFGTGGTKNTGLQAANITKAQLQAKAQVIAAQFEMSFDSAYKLTQLSAQIQAMKQQRQMTQADRDAVVQNAFKIAGVTQTEVSSALVANMQTGDTAAVEDVMNKAAQNLGMPSGQTFRDKLLPLFDAQ